MLVPLFRSEWSLVQSWSPVSLILFSEMSSCSKSANNCPDIFAACPTAPTPIVVGFIVVAADVIIFSFRQLCDSAGPCHRNCNCLGLAVGFAMFACQFQQYFNPESVQVSLVSNDLFSLISNAPLSVIWCPCPNSILS